MAKLTVASGPQPEAERRFQALVQPHYETLYRTAYRLTRSTHDAEDLVQEVCVRAYPRLTELERLEQPRGWLAKVLYRLFIDSARRYERSNVTSLELIDAAALEGDEPGPPEQAERALAQRLLDRAWVHLDREQQVLLALHDVEGYTLNELHEVTGLKEGTLKSRLHRARVRLGKLLQRDAGSEGPARTGAVR